MRSAFELTALLCMVATIATADPGHDLFTGQNPLAADGRIARFACHNCHGRDGRGGREGDVPEIAGDFLRKRTDQRPGYNLAAFQNALSSGVDVSGRKLSRIMPRYDLTEVEMTLLWNYLLNLPLRQAQGVAPDHVRFGVIIDPARPEIGIDYLQSLESEMARAFPSGTVYGRRVEFVALRDPVEQAGEVIAAVAMPAAHSKLTDQLTALGLPVLFPLTTLTGSEDVSIQRAFTPTERDVNGAISQHLTTTTASRIAIAADRTRAEALIHLIHLEMPNVEVWWAEVAQDPTMEDPDVIVDLGGRLPATLPEQAMVYRLASQISARPFPPDSNQHFLVIEAPDMINLAIEKGLHPLEAHAALTSSVLTAALSQAGRDLTRSRLLSQLDGSELGRQGLDYARLPLTGTDYVRIIELRNAD